MNDATLYEDIVLGAGKRMEKPETAREPLCHTSDSPPCIGIGENQTSAEEFGEKSTSFPFSKEDINDIYMEIPAKTKRRESLMSSLFINVASFLDV